VGITEKAGRVSTGNVARTTEMIFLFLAMNGLEGPKKRTTKNVEPLIKNFGASAPAVPQRQEKRYKKSHPIIEWL
jgi:hypothetical protein